MASLFDACRDIIPMDSGNQKTVFSARHSLFGKVVIKKGQVDNPDSLERIKREVDILKMIRSNYYPKQHDFLVMGNDFEIMEEFIEGNPLRKVMNQFQNVNSIFTLLHQLVNGLSVIWDKKIVHRDLKPDNIIIKPNGAPVVIDLGIARKLDATSLTHSFPVWGPCTPAYASPEQLANKKSEISLRSDFFCLGIIALELYLGVHPFDPSVVENNDNIINNISNGKYASQTATKFHPAMTELAKHTLQAQPYKRFPKHQSFQSFLKKYI